MSPAAPHKRATLAYLAEELNVSRTTVSNAYNRPDQLSKELRERVLETAKRLGYSGPDPVARSLRTRQSGAVGLLLTEELSYAVRDPAANQFLAGLAESCGNNSRGLLLIPAAEIGDINHAAAVVNQASVDGFIVYSVASSDPYLQAVLDRNVPTVVVDQPTDLPDLPIVTIDDYAAMKKMADHIFDLGHRNVSLLTIRLDPVERDGVVTLEQALNASMHVQQRRVRAVVDSAREHGIDPETILIVENFDNKLLAGHQSAAFALEHKPDTTALICTADVVALGALLYAQDAGLKVPQDLTITGFDGIPDAMARNLTTIVQPNSEKGFSAGELFFARETGEKKSVVLDTTFHLGGTSAAPRSA